MKPIEAEFKRLCEDEEYFYEKQREINIIDRRDTLNSLYEMNAIYSEWALLTNLAEKYEARAKLHLEKEILPTLRLDAAKVAANLGLKKPTKQDLEDAAYKTDAYKVAAEHYQRATENANNFRKVEFALRIKKDMLQSINSRQKSELSTV